MAASLSAPGGIAAGQLELPPNSEQRRQEIMMDEFRSPFSAVISAKVAAHEIGSMDPHHWEGPRLELTDWIAGIGTAVIIVTLFLAAISIAF